MKDVCFELFGKCCPIVFSYHRDATTDEITCSYLKDELDGVGRHDGVSHGDEQKFNYAVADMFDEIVYEATGKRLEDYVAERKTKEIANFTIVAKSKEGDNL